MTSRSARPIEQIVDEQVARWRATPRADELLAAVVPRVVTVSRQPGSGGHALARRLAEALEYDLFDREIIDEVARSAHMSAAVVESLDEKGRNAVEDWVCELMDAEHLWADDYLRHLVKVIGTIRSHGRAVIVGRGASFILAPRDRFAVRVVAPLASRVFAVAQREEIDEREARRWVMRTEAARKAYIRRYFGVDDADPQHYDVTLNLARIDLESAAATITRAMGR